MVDYSNALRLLNEIEFLLQESNLDVDQKPHETAFMSQEPFCIDTMTAEQWLKWIFIPKMTSLIDNQHPLPTRFALTPYFEEALPKGNEPLISLLRELDLLLNQE